MREVLPFILRRLFLTLVLVWLLLIVPWPRFSLGPTEINLPSVKSALVVFLIVISLGKTLYDTLFSRH